MNRRRIITRVVVFLLAGAIVNVAVAWGLAIRTNPITSADWETARRYVVGVSAWLVNHYSKTGVQRFWSRYYESSDIKQYWSPNADVEGIIPTWGGLDRPRRGFLFLDVIGYGWPCISMWSQLAEATDDRDAKLTGAIRWRTDDWKGIDTGEWNVEVRVPRVLPLFPAWPGFAINTIFYAAILWLMFATPRVLHRKRRMKRGLCPACAYPVGASEVCSECGARFPTGTHVAPGESPGVK